MSNISQIKIVPYTLTPADAAGFLIYVPVLWDAAFNDTNYVIGLSCRPVNPAVATIYGVITQVTAAGFVAQCVISGSVGDTVEIEATGTHRS